MRLFIGLNMPEKTKDELVSVQQRLHSAAAAGRFSHRENLHLTLAFLGEQPPERLEAVSRAMKGTFVPRLELCFDHAGRFSQKEGELWWVGLRENKALLVLRKQLCENLLAEGFVLEKRSFKPHLTLARQVRLLRAPENRLLLPKPVRASVDRISLMESTREHGRLVYTELFSHSGEALYGL